MTHKAILIMMALMLSVSAQAAEVGGVKLDDRASIGGQTLVLNGAGIRTKAIFKVYVASLYLPSKAASLDAVLALAPRRIQLNLLRNLSSDQLVDALVDGLNESNSAPEIAAVKTQTAELVTIMKGFKEIKEGDVVTLDFADGATRIGFNGAAKGTIAGDAFNKALTRVWLGDKAVQADSQEIDAGRLMTAHA